MAIVLAILAISMMIIAHEAGHYFVARWSGMRVDRFSLGFGPPILKWTRKGTQFQLAPILFGGFVHIVGMNPHEDYDEKDPSVYPNRPTILRFFTIFAGPFTNMILAVVLAFSVFAFAGVDVRTGRTQVADVTKDDPADGLLKADDIILAVNGETLTVENFHRDLQKTQGAPMVLTVLRAGQQQKLVITPRWKDAQTGWLLGIHIVPEITHKQLGLGRAAIESVKYPVEKSKLILGGLWQIVTGKVEPEFQGPVRITSEISKSIQNGWVDAFELLAVLNVYLCLFNLLPFPALDGGRLAFLSYELATRRRPNAKVETAIHLAGGLVLIVLMLFVTYKEVANIKKLFS